jgi:hypothetical protein
MSLMPRPLGRATWLAYAPLRLAVAWLRCALAWPLAYLPAWAGGQAGWAASLCFGFLVFGEFLVAEKFAKPVSVLSLAKILK